MRLDKLEMNGIVYTGVYHFTQQGIVFEEGQLITEGKIYEGYFRDNKLFSGKIISRTTHNIREGEFNDNESLIKGTLVIHNDTIWTGDFKEGIMIRGTVTNLNDNDIIEKVEYKDPHTVVRIVYRTGMVETGVFSGYNLVTGMQILNNVCNKGIFKNGYLIRGTRIIRNISREDGVFEKGELVDGTKITPISKLFGKFRDGQLTEGKIEHHSGGYEDGTFRFGVLYKGTRCVDNIKEIGLFNTASTTLIEGERISDKMREKGTFINDKLDDGIITFKDIKTPPLRITNGVSYPILNYEMLTKAGDLVDHILEHINYIEDTLKKNKLL
jgi:hypothetical protein